MTNKQRELKQLDFMRRHHAYVIKECCKHMTETGYLQLYVDNNFKLITSSAKFIPGEFNKEEYISVDQAAKPIDPGKIKDAFWIYYTVLWFENKTKWDVKELVLSAEL